MTFNREMVAALVALVIALPVKAQTRDPQVQPCTALCAGLRGNPPGVQVTSAPPPMPADTAPGFVRVIDAVAAQLELPRLREPGALGGAIREVRLWSGFGLGGHRLLLVRETSEGVSGRLALWWRPGAMSDSVKREMISSGCRMRSTGTLESCDLTIAFDWAELMRRIDALDPWTFPSPPRRIGLDGCTLVVEVRRGEAYRTYRHRAGQDDYPESARAEALLDLEPRQP